MSAVIEEIKNYIMTPEGAEWFTNAVKDVQEQISGSNNDNQINLVNRELPLAKKEGIGKPLLVSRREMENVIRWMEMHPDPEKNGRYALKVGIMGGRQVLKPLLLMRGEKVSSSQLITDDPKKILSGEISTVTTRGTHYETFCITLTN